MDMPDNGEGEGFGTYDPESVLPPLEDDVVDDSPESQETTEPTFDERYIEPFKGLMYLGALTKEFEWLGHTFVIRTLTTNELLQVGLIVREYADSIAQGRAYAAAMVATATISVDGEDLPTPVMTSDIGNAWVRQRFNYVTSRWFPYTIDKVYSEYLELDKQASEVIEQMGNLSG
jgi:hypothetical protein